MVLNPMSLLSSLLEFRTGTSRPSGSALLKASSAAWDAIGVEGGMGVEDGRTLRTRDADFFILLKVSLAKSQKKSAVETEDPIPLR
jgi:hypothetical protein